jgi:hypothetical protein
MWWFFYIFFIWSHVSGLMRFCNGSNKGTASNFMQVSDKVWQRPWQLLDKRLGKKAWAIHIKSKLTETKKDWWDTSRASWRACSSFSLTSVICPGSRNSQFRILLWRFMATAQKCAKISPQTLATKELAVASQQCTISCFSFLCFPNWRQHW